MFYVFAHPVVIGNTKDDPKRIDMDLTAGVIHQVDVLFQDGCLHQVRVQIFHASLQLWPSNRGKALRGNATVVSFREFVELESGGTALHALIWGDPVIGDVEVVIQIGLLPKKVIQPLSFDALLSAAAGLE